MLTRSVQTTPKPNSKQGRILWLVFLGCLLAVRIAPSAAQYIQAPAAMHVQTTISTGVHTPEEVVRLARDAGIKVVVFADHESVSLAYGIPPFRNVLRRKVTRGGVFQYGAARYLQMTRDLADKYPDMVVLPGVESVPFYYWSGNPLQGLTAHDWHKHLLIIGFSSAQQIEGLPILHGKLSRRYTSRLLAPILVFFSL